MMRQSLTKLLALLLGILTVIGLVVAGRHVSSARRSAEAARVLKRALDANQRVSYRGESESETNYCGRWVRMRARVLHRAPQGHRIEYLSKPLAGMVIVNDGRHIWRLDPRRKALFRVDSTHSNEPHKLEALLRNYQASVVHMETIAGRRAHLISLTPRISGRGWKRLWVDAANGTQLGSEDYGPEGRLVARSRFASIKFPRELPVAAFAKPKCDGYRQVVLGQGVDSMAHLSKELGFAVLSPRYLPQGFHLEHALRDRCRCDCKSGIAHLRYGDGVSSISVMECPKCAGMASHCHASEFGAARIVVVDRGPLNIAVIGAVSTAELQKIAESIPE